MQLPGTPTEDAPTNKWGIVAVIGGLVVLGFVIYMKRRGAVKTSSAGKDAIKQREGLRLSVYKDSAGLATIGFGHLIKKDEQYTSITLDTANSLFDRDLADAESVIASYVTNKIPNIKLTQNQYDALASLVFNIGKRAFVNADGSLTQLWGALNSGNMKLAAEKIKLFDKVRKGGQLVVDAGVAARRAGEVNQFMVA